VSLTKPPEMTPEKLAAVQENGRRSRGPVTPEGLQRCREAKIRHGFYSREGDEALRILGEDPNEFRNLFRSLVLTWQPVGQFEECLLLRLARALWRLERADRQQEAMAVSRIKRLDQQADREAREGLLAYERKRRRLIRSSRPPGRPALSPPSVRSTRWRWSAAVSWKPAPPRSCFSCTGSPQEI
jgi:hypothetical protein